jgi:hypothetical protein
MWRNCTIETKKVFMDKKIIEKYGSDINCYKLKSARQKKRAVKEAEENKLLSLRREERKIWQQQRNMGMIELDPPIVRGWKRFFVLREDVARCNDAAFYQNILDKINHVEICKRKDFKTKKKYLRKKGNWELIEQKVKQHEPREFSKCNFSDKEKALFDEKYVKARWGKGLIKVFVFKEQWRFVFKIKPNIITHVQAVDEELENRSNEISNYFDRTNKRNTLNRLLGHRVSRWRRWDNGEKPKYKFDKKNLNQMLDEVKMNDNEIY